MVLHSWLTRGRHGPVGGASAPGDGLDSPVWTRTEIAVVAMLGATALWLLLWGLGNQFFWNDEAETARVARTVMTHGIPKGHDGRNFIQSGSAAYNENLTWVMDPWLSFYTVAASFALFGETEFAGRLPFALLGVASVLLTHLLARELYGDRWTGVAAAGVLLCNVPFLLLSRQCRYYALAAFFAILGLYGYQRIVCGRRNGCVIFFIASVLLFHSQYLYSAVLLASVLLHALLFHRSALRSLALPAIGAGAANALWIVGFAGLPQMTVQGGSQNFLMNVLGYARLVADWIAPLWLVAIPFVAHGWSLYRRNQQPPRDLRNVAALLLPVTFLLVNIVALSAVTTWMLFRYLGPAIAPMCVTLGALLRALLPRRRVLFVVCLTCFAILGRMPDYLYEITHDYDGPIEGIVKYLKENAAEDHLVAISFGDVPLEFYTTLRAVGLYYDEDLTPALQADWVVLRKYWDAPRIRSFLSELPREEFVATRIDSPDLPFENIPEPNMHRFRTDRDEDRIVIYRRIRPGEQHSANPGLDLIPRIPPAQ